MKSIFTKLGTLLFCGAVALVGCSDFSADLKEVNDRVDKLTEETKQGMTGLRAEINAVESYEQLVSLLNGRI